MDALEQFKCCALCKENTQCDRRITLIHTADRVYEYGVISVNEEKVPTDCEHLNFIQTQNNFENVPATVIDDRLKSIGCPPYLRDKVIRNLKKE